MKRDMEVVDWEKVRAVKLEKNTGTKQPSRKYLARKNKYPKETWDYIDDPKIFKAVSFAKALIEDGFYTGLAIYKAAKYYKLPQKDVSRAMSSQAAQARKNYKDIGFRRYK